MRRNDGSFFRRPASASTPFSAFWLSSSPALNRIFIFSNSTTPGLLLFRQFVISHPSIPPPVHLQPSVPPPVHHQPSVSPHHLPPPDSLLLQQLTGSSAS